MPQPIKLFCVSCLRDTQHMPGGDPMRMNCSCGQHYVDQSHEKDIHRRLSDIVMVAKHHAKEHNCNYNIILMNPDENGELQSGSTYEYVADSYFNKERPNIKLLGKTDDLLAEEEFNAVLDDDKNLSFLQYDDEITKFIQQMSDTSQYRDIYAGMLPNRKSFGKPVAVRTEPKIQRNEPCPCGSGKKYKKCCINT